jgi:radical SAM protein with 4Fe4S-binding SPASM domain
MENGIVVLIILAIVATIIWYLIRSKKRNETCIGCPYAKQCGGGCNYASKDLNEEPMIDT